jgi:hypothetical protein
MDSDLIAEIDALQEVAQCLGIQMFRYACHDGWVREFGGLPKSPLFRCCTPSGREEFRPDRSGLLCGCLMEIKTQQIRGATVAAWTDAWTDAIRNDERIPIGMPSIYPGELFVFAEWQQAWRDWFTAEGLAEPPPEYIPLAVRWPWKRPDNKVD